jgi:hypothetical protein
MSNNRVNAVSQMNLVAGVAKYSLQQQASSSSDKARQLLESSKTRKAHGSPTLESSSNSSLQKPRKWELPKNKGVENRAAKDGAEWARLKNPHEHEEIQARLAKKAKIYEKLSKGRTGGLTEAQIANLNVDVRVPLIFNYISPNTPPVRCERRSIRT